MKQNPDIVLSPLSWLVSCVWKQGRVEHLPQLSSCHDKEGPDVCVMFLIFKHVWLHSDVSTTCLKTEAQIFILFGLSAVCCLLLLTNRMFTGIFCFVSSLIRSPSQFLEFMCWWMSEMFWMLRKYLFLLLSSTSWKLLWVSFPSPWAPPCRQVRNLCSMD